jgi:hypothetical protein
MTAIILSSSSVFESRARVLSRPIIRKSTAFAITAKAANIMSALRGGEPVMSG